MNKSQRVSRGFNRLRLLATRRTVLVAVVLLSLCVFAVGQAAKAQDVASGGGQVSLLKLTFEPMTSAGRLVGCELVYLVGFQDHIYRNGDAVLLNGSVTAVDAGQGKGIALGFKITPYDVVGDNRRVAPINYAYLSAEGRSFAGQEYAKRANDDGGLLIAYDMFKVPSLGEALMSGEFQISFNRYENSMDVTVPVNFLRDDPSADLNFDKCFDKIITAKEQELAH